MAIESLHVSITDDEIMDILQAHLEEIYNQQGWEFYCLVEGELPKELVFNFEKKNNS